MFTFFSINNLSRYFICAFFIFFLFVLIFNSPLFDWKSKEFDNVDTSGEMILARLSRAMAELSALKAQNEELRNLIQGYIPLELKPNFPTLPKLESQIYKENIITEAGKTDSTALDKEYELARRKLKSDIKELWNHISTSSNSSVKSFVKEIKDSLLYDVETISKRDEHLRRKQLQELSNYVQEKLYQLQNPENCKSARKLVCNLNKGCGFGCQIHHLVYCTIVSMATSRTLILNSKNWRYISNRALKVQQNSKSLWELAFKPMSNSCIEASGSPRGIWKSAYGNDNLQVVDLPIIDSIRPRPNYLPLSIPEEISEKLVTLHGAPVVWFIGQILKFIMRPSPEIENFLNEKKRKFGFDSPIVGVHVRRTDKINTEAAYHPLSEYMSHVEEYFDSLELFNQRQNNPRNIKRVVYLATDDINVWKKEIQTYEQKGYKFIGDYEISNTASVGRRYSFDSLKNIILDVWLLSETEYIICTFSSQVCRLAYELMQSRNSYSDKSSNFFSLDDIYYFGGQSSHNQVAVLNHKSKDGSEINMKIGDVIGIAGNHWNGYSKGVNRETQENGLYPGFKTIEKIDTAEFELFKN